MSMIYKHILWKHYIDSIHWVIYKHSLNPDCVRQSLLLPTAVNEQDIHYKNDNTLLESYRNCINNTVESYVFYYKYLIHLMMAGEDDVTAAPASPDSSVPAL